jgi:hypothetical protein
VKPSDAASFSGSTDLLFDCIPSKAPWKIISAAKSLDLAALAGAMAATTRQMKEQIASAYFMAVPRGGCLV